MRDDAARVVPVQERYPEARSFEAEIWAWPVATLNPIRADHVKRRCGRT